MVDILVTGKKISDMDLVTEVKGDEKIPTDAVGDLAISPDQLVEYVRNSSSTSWGKIVGDIDDQVDLKNKFYGINQTISTHVNNTDNPHNVTKNQIGLGNVDNTKDLDKPVSSATQEVLETKADKIYVDEELLLKADKTSFSGLIKEVKTGSILDFDQSFANSIGGYPLNARVALNNGDIVRSNFQNNTNNPNTNMSGWSREEDVVITNFGAVSSLDFDSGFAIQAAIDYAISKNIYFVRIPAGRWVSTQTIELAGTGGNSRDGVVLIGDNPKSTILYLKTDSNIPLILSKAWSGSHCGHGYKGISLYPHPDNRYVGTGLKLVGTCFMNVEDFNIFDFNVGLHFYNTREFGDNSEAGNAFCEYNTFTNGRIHTNNINVLFETTLSGDSSFHGNSFHNVQNQVRSNGVGVYLKGQASKIAVWYNAFVNMNFWTSVNLSDNMSILKLEYAQCSGLSGNIVCEGTGYIRSTSSTFQFEGNYTSLRNSEYPVFETNDAGTIGGASVVFHNLNSRVYNLAESNSSLINNKYLQDMQFLESKSRNYSGDRLSLSTIKRLTNSKTPQSGSYEGMVIGARTNCEVFFGEFPVDGGEFQFKPRIGFSANSPTVNVYSDNYIYAIKFFSYNGIASDTNTGYAIGRGSFTPDVTNVASLGTDTNRWAQARFQGLDINTSGVNPVLSDSEDFGSTTRRWSKVYTTSVTIHNTNGIQANLSNTYSIGSSTSNFKDIFLQNAPTVVSDARHKVEISELTQPELECAVACGKLYRKYKLNTAVDEKGLNAARYHIGVIAQEVVQCFADHNLDWRKYGIITYEKWDAIEAVEYQAATYDENGQELIPEIQAIEGREAGEIYMVRYDELNSFINAGLDYRIANLELLNLN